MALNYSAVATGADLQANLASSTLSTEIKAAISDILSLDTATTVGVASIDSGANSITTPLTQQSDVLIADFAGAAGDKVDVNLPQYVVDNAQAYVFNSDADLTLDFTPVASVIASGNGNDQITANSSENIVLDGGNGNDTLLTGSGNDSISGGAGNDSISAGTGNDTIAAGEGNDTVDGGSGFDIVQIAGSNAADYSFTVSGDTVTAQRADGSAAFASTNAEVLSFGNSGLDNVFIVDNQEDAHTLGLYGLLGRSGDVEGANYWLDDSHNGATLTDIANNFLNSAEFQNDLTAYQNTTGESGNTAYIDLLYQNVLGREADQGGRDFWVSALDNGATQADVAIAIVGSPEADTIDSVIVVDGTIV